MELLTSLKSLSGLVLLFGVVVAVLGAIAGSMGKPGKEKIIPIAIALVVILTLVVQFAIHEKDSAAAKAQAEGYHREGITAARGSDLCPVIGMGASVAGQRPSGISVGNPDTNANIFDLVIYIQEISFSTDGRMTVSLHPPLPFRTVPAGAGLPAVPFELQSHGNRVYLQFDLSTRRKICSGVIGLRADSNGRWIVKSYPVHEGPSSAHVSEITEAERRFAQGLDW
jgi:hypothetical protein